MATNRVQIIYTTQSGCGFCNYWRPTVQRIAREQGWKFKEQDIHQPGFISPPGVTITPSILVYVNGKYKGFIEGVQRQESILSLVKGMET